MGRGLPSESWTPFELNDPGRTRSPHRYDNRPRPGIGLSPPHIGGGAADRRDRSVPPFVRAAALVRGSWPFRRQRVGRSTTTRASEWSCAPADSTLNDAIIFPCGSDSLKWPPGA